MNKILDSAPAALPLFARAGLGAIPGAGRLPFIAGGGGEIPADLRLELPDVEVDPGHLAHYSKVCGFALRETLPATYPHVLAFPLHLALMTDSRFPLSAVGLVHISNRIRQHRPLRSSERLDLSVNATALEPHPKGRAFTLITEARVDGELVWEGASTNLRRGDGSGDTPPRPSSGDTPDPSKGRVNRATSEELRDEAEWRLGGDLGRRYGGVSGDRNPIHLYGLTAKAFGFPRQIAHGMWTKARCLAALGPRLPDAFEVDVEFRKPILLPARVAFATGDGDGGTAFAVHAVGGDASHLGGRVTL